MKKGQILPFFFILPQEKPKEVQLHQTRYFWLKTKNLRFPSYQNNFLYIYTNQKQNKMNLTEIKVNQEILSHLYGGRYGYVKEIRGIQKPSTITSFMGGAGSMGGNANIIIRFENGTETNVPECIVRGSQWDLLEMLTPEEIVEYDKKYFAAIEERNKKATEKTIADEKLKAELIEKYSYLTRISGKYEDYKSSQKIAKQNIVTELKKNFPNIKFSVRKRSSDCYIIEWTDGATTDEVSKITSKFEDHETDSTGDFRDYSPSIFNDLFGGFKYIFEERNMSKETEAKFLEWANAQYAIGSVYNSHNPQNLAHQLFCELKITSPNFKIVRNSETCGLNSPKTFWTTENI